MGSYILCISFGYLIAIAAIIWNYKRLMPQWLQLFLIFIPVEFVCQYLGSNKKFFIRNSNYYLINIQEFVSLIFYLIIYWKLITGRKTKIFICSLAGILILANIVEIVFVNKSVFAYLRYSFSLGKTFVIICSFIYLAQLLTKEELINYFKVPMFWITLGIIISIFGVWLYLALSAYLRKIGEEPRYSIDLFIFILINNLQYILFAIGFVCNRRWKKIS